MCRLQEQSFPSCKGDSHPKRFHKTIKCHLIDPLTLKQIIIGSLASSVVIIYNSLLR